MRYSKLCLVLACTALSVTAIGQQKAPREPMLPTKAPKPAKTEETGLTWTKRISRIITLTDSATELKSGLRTESEDNPLAQRLTDAVQNGKVTAYSTIDSRFTIALSPKQVKELFYVKSDTTPVLDPVSGKTVYKEIRDKFNYAAITKYRILEEWTFDRTTAKTTVQIVGIAPMRDVYVNGAYRGTQALYWLKYNEAKDIVNTYEQEHPHCSIGRALWDDYFGVQE